MTDELRVRFAEKDSAYLQRVFANAHEYPGEWSESELQAIRDVLADRGIEMGKSPSERIKDLQVVTTMEIPGKLISATLGVVSGTVVMGTGFMSELSGSISDFLGTRAAGFQNKLSEARDAAIAEMSIEAAERGAEGVVGIELDHTSIGNNMLVVAAYGTAVKLIEDTEGLAD